MNKKMVPFFAVRSIQSLLRTGKVIEMEYQIADRFIMELSPRAHGEFMDALRDLAKKLLEKGFELMSSHDDVSNYEVLTIRRADVGSEVAKLNR